MHFFQIKINQEIIGSILGGAFFIFTLVLSGFVSFKQLVKEFPYSDFLYPYRLEKQSLKSASQCLDNLEKAKNTTKYLDLDLTNSSTASLVQTEIATLSICINKIPQQLADRNFKKLSREVNRGLEMLVKQQISSEDFKSLTLEKELRMFLDEAEFLLSLQYPDLRKVFWIYVGIYAFLYYLGWLTILLWIIRIQEWLVFNSRN